MVARQMLYHLGHSTSPFLVLGIFKIRSLELFAWVLQTTMLLILDS
jgi:hypothetical protein